VCQFPLSLEDGGLEGLAWPTPSPLLAAHSANPWRLGPGSFGRFWDPQGPFAKLGRLSRIVYGSPELLRLGKVWQRSFGLWIHQNLDQHMLYGYRSIQWSCT
jgi:hypothetical protein